MFYVFATIPLVLGISLLCRTALDLTRVKNILENGLIINATVVKNEKYFTRNTSRIYYYMPVVHFLLDDTQYEALVECRLDEAMEIGSTINVIVWDEYVDIAIIPASPPGPGYYTYRIWSGVMAIAFSLFIFIRVLFFS